MTEDLVDAEEIEAEEISEADDALPEFSKVDQEDVNDEDDEVHLADEPFDGTFTSGIKLIDQTEHTQMICFLNGQL